LGIIHDLLGGNKKRSRRYYRNKKRNENKKYRKTYYPPQSKTADYQQTSQVQNNFADPTPRFPTLKGEKVRSLSEKYIADYLFTNRLEYQYEKAITLEGYTIRPDFYLPIYNIYIEFWGMLNGNNPQYWKSFEWKTDKYQRHKVKFIPLLNEDLPDLANVFPIKLQQAIRSK